MSVCDQSRLDSCSRQGTACSQLRCLGGLCVCCLQPHKDGRQVATVQQMVRSSFQFRNPENVKSYERECWFENKGCARLKIGSCLSPHHCDSERKLSRGLVCCAQLDLPPFGAGRVRSSVSFQMLMALYAQCPLGTDGRDL